MPMTPPVRRERPHMRNYGISTSESGLLDWSWAEQRLIASRNYWIASTRPDGKPHVAPVWGVWFEGTLYFSSDPGARKARNLAANPAVVVHLESGDDVVIIEGVMERETNNDVITRMAAAYFAKYPVMGSEPSVEPFAHTLRLRPQVAIGWLETSFPNTATRWLW